MQQLWTYAGPPSSLAWQMETTRDHLYCSMSSDPELSDPKSGLRLVAFLMAGSTFSGDCVLLLFLEGIP